jgi:hypothetical protein
MLQMVLKNKLVFYIGKFQPSLVFLSKCQLGSDLTEKICATALSITTFSITTLSNTLTRDTQHK